MSLYLGWWKWRPRHRSFVRILSEDMTISAAVPTAHEAAVASEDGRHPVPRIVVLVRHGQTTYNIEGRLPGQLPNVPLTDEGRRQAHQAAVALAASTVSAVVSSPLERAYETAQIIARGWGLEVRTDDRLQDTDVGGWAGLKLDELTKSAPDWKRFVQDAEFVPPGGESLANVMARAVTVVEELRHDETIGGFIVVVAHADVIKFIIGHYQGEGAITAARMHVSNASLSALRFEGEGPPHILAVNWTASPAWLLPPLAAPLGNGAPTADSDAAPAAASSQ
jgi:probable phosphoglycerate mutase